MKDHITVNGISTLRAYRAGVLPALIQQGYTLDEAQGIARTLGALAHEDSRHNLIVTAGLGLLGDSFIDAENGPTYFAIGTGTTAPAITDTTLTTEAARKAITARTRAGAIVTLATFFLSSECTYAIKECGAFGGSATASADTGTLFSHYLQDYDNSAGLYDLTFNYDLTLARA